MDWTGYDNIIATIENHLINDGWEREDNGDWVKLLLIEDMEDPYRYIGKRPLGEILAGNAAHVYGTGATGIGNFMASTYVADHFEENLTDTVQFSDEELELLDDEDIWSEVSSYVQSWIRPEMDSDDVYDWLAAEGWFDAPGIYA